jgi:DNA-binding transcriptional LysR family regulator
MANFDGQEVELQRLVALDVLLRERSVTRAAARLGLTQSTLSHTLARLREQLGDPLLVRVGREVVLTPRAEALAEPLGRALREVGRVLREAGRFVPEQSERGFTLHCPDLLAPALPDLLRAMETEAPRASLLVSSAPGDAAALLGGGADLALAPAPSLREGAGLVARRLGTLRWCVLARRGHPALKKRFTLAAWTNYPHVVVRNGNHSPNRVANALDEAGISRCVRLQVPTFLAAALVVSRSEHFLTAPRELVGELAQGLGLVAREPPLTMPPLPVAALWLERVQADEGHIWFRRKVIAVLEARLARRSSEKETPAPPPNTDESTNKRAKTSPQSRT